MDEKFKKYATVDLLNSIIDQAKYIRNKLVNNETAEVNHVRKDLDYLEVLLKELPKD